MKPLLLVVENDSGTRRLLDVFLTRESFHVDPVPTGVDALLLLDRVDYAAVVLDLTIPGRTGRDVLEELAARKPWLLERIVVISSATEAHLRDVRGRYPAVAVLRKPFDLIELLTLVRERAARHAGATELDAGRNFVRRSVIAGAKAGIVARWRDDALHVVTDFGQCPEPLHSLALQAVREKQVVRSTALAAVPIIDASGVAGWSFAEPRLFGHDEVARLTAIAVDAAELLGESSTTAASRGA